MNHTRISQILQILGSDNKYFTASQIAEKLEVSPKTIRECIKNSKTYLEKLGVNILVSSRLGYKLDLIDSNNLTKLLKQMETKTIPQTFDERVDYVVRTLLLNEHYIKIQKLCDDIFISKSSMDRILKEMKAELQKYDLRIEHKPFYGIRIEGEEQQRRLFIVYWLYHKHQNIINEPNQVEIGSILLQICKEENYELTTEGIENLILHLYVAVKRIRNGKRISQNSILQKDKYPIDYAVAEKIGHALEKTYQIELPEIEIEYITIHLLGKRNFHNTGNIQHRMEPIVLDILHEILDTVKRTYNIDLSGDSEFFTHLSLHMIPMLERLNYNLNIYNPLCSEIKNKYVRAYSCAQIAGNIIEKKTGHKVSTDELSYMALHFSVALQKYQDNIKNPNKILIVCSSGTGTSRILLHKLTSKYNIDPATFEICSLLQLQSKDLKKYCCILSTLQHLEIQGTPVFYISSMMEIQKEELFTDIIIHKTKTEMVKKYIKFDNYFLADQVNSREEALQYMISRVSLHQKLPDDLLHYILEREAAGNTEIGNQICMPHTIAPVVEQPFIAVMILKKPLLWSTDDIKIIFLFCLSKEYDPQMDLLIDALADFSISTQTLNAFLQNPTYNQFINSLLRHMS